MFVPPVPPLWAIHIDNGFLTLPWSVGGYVVAGLLALVGAWRIRDEEIPRVAVLAAAFFVASLLHVPVPWGPRTHLLLNGLLGVVLGRRALLAVPVGLFLQAVLFLHGGLDALGVNSCVMGLPALLSWGLFAALKRVPWVRRPWFRAGLVALSCLAFALSLVYAVAVLVANVGNHEDTPLLGWANEVTFHPATLAAALAVSAAVAWAERRLENKPEFPVGLLVGETAVVATVLLNGAALWFGVRPEFREHSRVLVLVLVTVIVHLPLAAIEGTVLGFTVSFLARVKPDMIGWKAEEETACLVESAP